MVRRLTYRLCPAPSTRYQPRFVAIQGEADSNDAVGDDGSKDFEANHAAIIARTLRWADEAAARHEYAEALRWIETVAALGDGLPGEYDSKRRRWLQALD